MPICQPCRVARHDRCDDNAHTQLYRGCYCQHRSSPKSTAESGIIARRAQQTLGERVQRAGGVDAAPPAQQDEHERAQAAGVPGFHG